MKLIVDDVEYEAEDPTKMTLAEAMLLRKQSADFGIPLTIQKIERLVAEISRIPAEERRDSEAMENYTAALIWISRRRAGEKVTFEQANSFTSYRQHVELSDLSDEEAQPDPPKPRAASARGARKPRNPNGTSSSSRTSKPQSSPVSSVSA